MPRTSNYLIPVLLLAAAAAGNLAPRPGTGAQDGLAGS